MKRYRKILKGSAWALAIVIFIRVFLFQTATVTDFHMSSTLLPGDRVVVNKFSTGLRLPISIIGLPGTDAPYADGIRLPYLRLPALRKMRLQDVIVFNNPVGADKPIDRKKLMFGRIAGLPTDTVQIKDKMVTVNHRPLNLPATARKEYRVITTGSPISDAFVRRYDLEKPRLIEDIGIFDVDLPQEAVKPLQEAEGIRTVRETKQFWGDPSTNYYPRSDFFMWNRDQYGPLMVPVKGMTVNIEIKTIDFYRDLIETQEHHDVMVDYAGVHIDGHLATSYTFKKSYYFILSDNRDHPNDSRIIGFIPADHVLGVARRVIWSRQKAFDYIRKFHPARILKRVR